MGAALDPVIRHGLSESHRRRAAEIFYTAFREKYRVVLGSEAQGAAILAAVMDAQCAIIALLGDTLAGVAGIRYAGSRLNRWRYGPFIEQFGRLGGLVRGTLIRVDRRPQRAGELLMDGLAVDAALRGRGVGTALLDAVCAFAREHGYETVRLDVVDTNPRAQKLYERVGFVPTETHRLPVFLRSIIGFSAYTTMVKAAL
ncbi:MAG: GNAT family N-acetyltransferase [Anaerolineae bacterium]|nr:GNAT family N-acetyltransferase [Anaerolineae bacterium]